MWNHLLIPLEKMSATVTLKIIILSWGYFMQYLRMISQLHGILFGIHDYIITYFYFLLINIIFHWIKFWLPWSWYLLFWLTDCAVCIKMVLFLQFFFLFLVKACFCFDPLLSTLYQNPSSHHLSCLVLREHLTMTLMWWPAGSRKGKQRQILQLDFWQMKKRTPRKIMWLR